MIRLLIVGSLIVCSLQPAIPCSCSTGGLTIANFINVDLMILGKVVSREEIDDCIYGSIYQYRLKVNEVIKGEVEEGKVTTIYSLIGDAYCGVYYDLGQELYLFAYRDTRHLFTNMCLRNLKVGDKNEGEMRALIDEYRCGESTNWFDRDGRLIATGKIIDRKPEGPWAFVDWIRWVAIGNYENGVKEGEWNYYRYNRRENKSGNLSKTEYYFEGMKLGEKQYLE